MHVGTIMESNDATFFEDIFSMKDQSSSSNQEMPSSSSQELVTIPEPTIAIENYDNPVEDDNEAPKRSKRQGTAKSFGHDFIVYLVDDTPTFISEAYASQDADYWKEAVRSEMDSILANGTWEVTDRLLLTVIKEVKDFLSHCFEMKDLGVADVILNIKLLKDDDGGITLLQSHYVEKILSRFSSLRRRLRLPHPVHRRAPTAGTVGLWNPASREPVRVRGNQVFGERSGATTGITTSSSDDEFLHTDNFFPDPSDFFDNLNIGDNDC
ncbi:hypothetical protein QYE76_035076 [Lolium multiflorum]|uniref:Gag-pol polyprotein n=1 Tax=Lolium multiflorum TaxID=4521 RepID=A0AAD8VNV5_LOLMU|nr:hypothetical protein QYE76_035076 [Lolium multiflorum]